MPSASGNWFSNFSLRGKLVVVLTALIALFLLMTGLLLRGQVQVREALDWSDHTYEVISEADSLLTQIPELQASMRGYALTQDPVFRQRYQRSVETFDEHHQALLKLTADNPEQQGRLLGIALQMRNWRQTFAEVVLRQADDPQHHESMLQLIGNGQGRAAVDAILADVHESVEVERALLKQRNRALLEQLEDIRMISLLALILSIVGGIFVEWLMRRTVGTPLAQQDALIGQVSEGRYDVAVPFQDRRDEVGAIARAIEELRKTSEMAQQRAWIKRHVATLGDLMTREREYDKFAAAILGYLCPAVGCGYGMMFRVSNGAVTQLAGYGYKERRNENRSAHDGLAAECARSGKPIVLDPVPEDYLRIGSGLGEAKPRCIHLWPLQGAQGTVGVLELASFTSLDGHTREMLDEVALSGGLALESLSQAIQTRELLEESRVQAEELQASEEALRVQAEDLRTTNEAVSEKSRALNEFNERLQGFQRELEEKNRDLEQASRYKSEFLANMSHELRTPLNSLLILAKDLADNGSGNLLPDQIEAAQIVYDSGRNLLNLINDILDLSKIEAGRMDISWESVELAALSAGIERNFRRTAQERGLDFRIELDSSLPAQIRSDGNKLTQVLVNLIGNALKFTHEGGVTLRIGRPAEDDPLLPGITREQTLALCVADTGIGIDDDKMKRLFQPFEQGDGTTSRRYGGTGLGLSISRALAQMLGGEIVAHSVRGEGSRFIVLLPERPSTDTGDAETAAAAPRPAVAPRRQEAPAAARSSAAPSPGHDDRERIGGGDVAILIVEDDAAFARVLADIARRKGYRALIAADGRSALELARRYRPHGILLDVELPVLDGWDVIEQLKNDVATRHIPVHFISANDDSQRGLAAGAVGFITKPATRETLDAAFARVLHFAGNQRRKLLVVDDEPAARLAIGKLLASQPADIVEAENAAQALDAVRAQSFDCIILDLSLPDASGFEVLEKLAALGPVPPVVIYSARELTRDEDLRLREYTDSVVIKGAQSPGRLLDEVSLFLHAVQRPAQQIAATAAEPVDLAGRTVLVVDDDMRNVFALSKTLRGHGLKVLVAQDGHKALAQLEQNPGIECVLMDVMMPGMDGYEATREIRKRPQWRELPVIAVTAKAMKGDREKCLEAGANDYLTKPIDVDKLLSMMHAWLHRA